MKYFIAAFGLMSALAAQESFASCRGMADKVAAAVGSKPEYVSLIESAPLRAYSITRILKSGVYLNYRLEMSEPTPNMCVVQSLAMDSGE